MLATDVSEWGPGAVFGKVDPALVAPLGRVSEQWRFKDPAAARPQQHDVYDPRSVTQSYDQYLAEPPA